jgi:phospholipid/cholesterol/gamma-HCH transport system substrate-binding protein
MRGAIVGAFVLGGLVLFGTGLFLIGDRRLLFSEQFELNTTFGRVTGLEVGTQVRLAGLRAGEVLEVRVPSRPSDPFVVRMRLREDLRSLIRTDSVATVQTDGIVGNAFIQVSVGSDDAPVVTPGDTLMGRDPVEFADLIQEGRETFRTVAAEIIDLRGDVSMAITGLTETAEAATVVIEEVGTHVESIAEASAGVVREAQGALAEAQGVLADIRAGQGTLGRLVTDDTLYQRVVGSSQEVERAVRNIREMTDRTRLTIEAFTGPEGSAQEIATTLRSALVEVREATADLAEGTEALKRNFLFRGFFEDRGFFDLDSISREAYLAGALERERTAIRIWIASDVLFVPDPASGVERLTDDGRRRIDTAMADLVRYPPDSPLVVEGYAEGESAFLRSADRAQTVRDYLLTRFRRRTTLTDIMPLSTDAVGSPRGDGRWSGVALVLFVDDDVLAETAAARAAARQP